MSVGKLGDKACRQFAFLIYLAGQKNREFSFWSHEGHMRSLLRGQRP
jgi:hypothetical protein